MAKAKSKRPVRGKDWHGWALKYDDTGLCFFARGGLKPADIRGAKWVKVRFVEVKGNSYE